MDDIFDKVREYAYKSKDEASKLTKQVIDKTGNIITQTKLNFTVSDIESKIFIPKLVKKCMNNMKPKGISPIL